VFQDVFIGVQVTTYDFGFMDNPITNQFDRSLHILMFFIENARNNRRNLDEKIT
jgi:hypothetical protein